MLFVVFNANVPEKKSHAMPLPPSFPISGHTIHPPPNTSMPPPPAPRGPGRRRADRHQSTTASLFSEPDPEASGEYDPAFDPDADGEADADGEVDAEGEVEYDEGDAEEASETDNSIYCSCRQKSYGEMIGCDNDDCPIEWVCLARHCGRKCTLTEIVSPQMCRYTGCSARQVVLPDMRYQSGLIGTQWADKRERKERTKGATMKKNRSWSNMHVTCMTNLHCLPACRLGRGLNEDEYCSESLDPLRLLPRSPLFWS